MIINSEQDSKEKIRIRQKEYKYEVMLSLWFAIHLDRLEIARAIYGLDEINEKILKTLREKGQSILLERRQGKDIRLLLVKSKDSLTDELNQDERSNSKQNEERQGLLKKNTEMSRMSKQEEVTG